MMLAGTHVDLRAELGLLSDIDAARAEAQRELDALKGMLLDRHLMIPDFEDEDIIAGVHRLVLSASCLLTGVALTDAVGDVKAQNVPGTFQEYPNWEIPLTDRNGVPVLLDDLFDHPRMKRLVAAIRGARA